MHPQQQHGWLIAGRSLAWTNAAALALAFPSDAFAQNAFVNWESPHTHPLELTPDGTRLLAVNTADARLEVFEVSDAGLKLSFEVPVGLDPVTVRAFSNRTAWVANRISDSISVVDLELKSVVATLSTDDEPSDIAFAGDPLRAWVSCSAANSLLVFDPSKVGAASQRIAIDGEDPRALGVSPDGKRVYVAVFSSGNDSTILAGGARFNFTFPPGVVNRGVGPHSGRNPPPNTPDGGGFDPAQRTGNPSPPAVGLIVKRNKEGHWLDDFGGDWTHLVSGPNAAYSGRSAGWELTDNDLGIVDTHSGQVRYVRHVMNTCMALAVHPGSGVVALVGTEAMNERRFEPRLRGNFLRVELACVSSDGSQAKVHALNPHLDSNRNPLDAVHRRESIGDPRAVQWSADGSMGWVAGMGSNNLVAIDAHGARLVDVPPIEVGAGPTGLALDPERARLYVLCRFDSSVAVVDLDTSKEIARAAFFDPTPPFVRSGRSLLYGTHEHSARGELACASCHVDARVDHLAWDLGDPSGEMVAVEGNNLAADNAVLLESEVPGRGSFEPFHPMKGPMTTQTLFDVIGKEPLHWRGDRAGLEDFTGAFVTLLGSKTPPSPTQMQDLEDFLATLRFPPNPFREFDNSLPTDLPLPGHHTTGRFGESGQPLPNGNARAGLNRFRTGKLDNRKVDCITCHTLPSGVGPDALLVEGRYQAIPVGLRGEHHHMLVSQDGSSNVSMKVPHLRNLYDKVGCDLGSARSHFGFGFLHDGSIDTLARFVNESAFSVGSDQDTADLVAFLLAFAGSDLPLGSEADPEQPPGPLSLDTHAAVGFSLTASAPLEGAALELVQAMLDLAGAGRVSVMVKGVHAGRARGWLQLGQDGFQSDRQSEVWPWSRLAQAAGADGALTYTVVPVEAARRMAIDRDADGALDSDEIDAGTNPADPRSLPPLPGAPR